MTCLQEVANQLQAVAVNALGGIIAALVAGLIVWVYFDRKDRDNLDRLRRSLSHPYPKELGCGKDLFIFHYVNPIQKSIIVRDITLVLADPKHFLRGLKPEYAEKPGSTADLPAWAFTQEPLPCIVPLRNHGRDFNPIQPEPDWKTTDGQEVSLLPGEEHRWWVLHLADPGDNWLLRMRVIDLRMEIVYEAFTHKQHRVTVSADKATLASIQRLIDGQAEKPKKETTQDK